MDGCTGLHIPDGFLDPYTALATYAVALSMLGYAIKRGDLLNEDRLVRITTLSAFIFAAQMISWPIPGGTSLHLVGGALAGILLGSWPGIVAMSIVIIIQCLVFHDGGITALGANLLNMAVISVLVGYAAYKAIVRLLRSVGSGRRRFLAGFVAGWLSLTLAGTMTGLEIGIAASILRRITYGLAVSLPIMSVWHGILGVVEGSITGSIISYIGFKYPRIIEAEV